MSSDVTHKQHTLYQHQLYLNIYYTFHGVLAAQLKKTDVYDLRLSVEWVVYTYVYQTCVYLVYSAH